ncbi:MAG: T9SS type A sorting domain-containing protein [Bacteroidota bacterium]
MKKALLIIVLNCMFVSLNYAQSVSFSIPALTNADIGTVISIPISTNSITYSLGGNTIASTYSFQYNHDVFSYFGFDNMNGVISPFYHSVNPQGGAPNLPVSFNIYDDTYVGWTHPDGVTFNLKLTYKGGSSAITLSTDFLSDGFEEIFPSTVENASGPLADIETASAGTWTNTATWNLGHIPNSSNGNIIIKNSPVTMDTNFSVNGNLTINSGGGLTVSAGKTLTTSGSFTIKSGGSFINNGSADNTAVVERNLGNDNSWHLLSSPVAGQSITSGFAPVSMNETFDFYKWDETVDKNTGAPWVNLRATSTTFNGSFESTFAVGRGYLVAYDGSWSASHSFSGTLGKGDKNISVSYSNNHCNLIGNPYPSAIDWNSVAWGADRTTVLGSTPNILIWNPAVGNYGALSGEFIGNGVTNIIAPNQGFFVVTVAAGTFAIPNAARVHPGSQSFLKSTVADMIRLHVSSSANAYSDEIIVNFNNNASSNQGLAKWFSMVNEAPSLYTVKNNQNFMFNTLTEVTNNLVVPVGFKAGVNGIYNISATDLSSFTIPTFIYLKDLKTNSLTDLNLHPMHLFAATTTDNVNRFQLIFSTTALAISEQLSEVTGIYSYENTITINSNENMKEIAIYNTLGQLIKTIGTSNGTVKVDMNAQPMGYYIVKVITDKNVYSEKVLVK